MISKLPSQQKGLSGYGMFLTLLMIGSLIVTLAKLAPLYFDYYSIKSSIEYIAKTYSPKTKKAIIESAIERQLTINNLQHSIKKSDFNITTSPNRKTKVLSISYEKKVHWFANLGLVTHFNYEKELTGHEPM